MIPEDFQLAWHDSDDYPEWGSKPRRPLVRFDGAHKGEWMESVIGPDVVTGAPSIYHIVRCELCIATHVWPLPEPSALAHYYATQFYQQEKPEYVERYERDRAWWEQCVHAPILATCERALPVTERPHARVLDIGAGPGIALDVALRQDWETWGIEPNAWLCEQLTARGHRMLQGSFESHIAALTTGETRFDIITLYEVLEHQPCPDEFLLACYDLLAPGGVLAVVVPNDYSPIQLAAKQRLGLQSYWLAPPQHLFYFTPKTLQLCLRRCGFQLCDMRGTHALDKFLLEDYNYIGNDRIGRMVHTWRMQDELHAVTKGQWDQREQAYRLNMQYRIGREIVAIARKGR